MNVSVFSPSSKTQILEAEIHTSSETYRNEYVFSGQSYSLSIEIGKDLVTFFFFDKGQIEDFKREVNLSLSNILSSK